MGRRDRTPSPPPRPPMGRPAPEGTYHFENYEDGKPKWAPGADNQRDYRDYRDSRREQRRPRKADAYDDAPPPPRDAPRQRQRRYSSSSDSDAPPPRRSNRRDRDRDEPKRDRDEPRRDRDEPKRDRRREQSSYDSYDEHYPPRRPRDAPRRDGYVSDNRHNRPRDSSRDRYGGDRDRRDNRRDERYDSMFNNSRRDTRRYDDRDQDRRDRYDDRDDRYRDRPKSSGRAVGKPGQPEWQRQAISMFKDYAMPIIKKEGQKYIQKQMSGFGQKR